MGMVQWAALLKPFILPVEIVFITCLVNFGVWLVDFMPECRFKALLFRRIGGSGDQVRRTSAQRLHDWLRILT
jgi:hypothetical protein